MEISGPTPRPLNPPPFDAALYEAMDRMAVEFERNFLTGMWHRQGRITPDRYYQNAQWIAIGAGILPWIPATQTRIRDLRSRARLALGEFLIDHGVIEVPEDDNDYW